MLTSVALPLLGPRAASARPTPGPARRSSASASLECAEQYWGSLADWERALVALAHGIAREPRLLLVDDLTRLARSGGGR